MSNDPSKVVIRKSPKTMKVRITSKNQSDLLGFMRMFEHAMMFSGVAKARRKNVMSLVNGAIGEDSLGEFILVPLPPKDTEIHGGQSGGHAAD